MSQAYSNPAECPICVRPPSSPYRVYDERGRVVQGCVDACHTGHLVTPSESARWHHRPEAKKLRKAIADALPRRRRAEARKEG